MNDPHKNPNYKNDLACIPELLKGLPDGIITSEKFWFYCTSATDTLKDALECYATDTIKW